MDHLTFKYNLIECQKFEFRGIVMYRLSKNLSEAKRRVKKQNKVFRNINKKMLELEEELKLLEHNMFRQGRTKELANKEKDFLLYYYNTLT